MTQEINKEFKARMPDFKDENVVAWVNKGYMTIKFSGLTYRINRNKEAL